MSSIEFTLHPFNQSNTPSPPLSVKGAISLQDNKINVLFRMLGEINNIFFPKLTQRPSRKDELWNTTCCELFVAKSGQPGYWEYNLSPSHDWAIFKFSNYRTAKTDDLSITEIDINTKIDKNSEFELNTILKLPGALIGQNLEIGVSSVIQNTLGEISYYALSHPVEKPDFHDRNCFTIHINAEQINE